MTDDIDRRIEFRYERGLNTLFIFIIIIVGIFIAGAYWDTALIYVHCTVKLSPQGSWLGGIT